MSEKRKVTMDDALAAGDGVILGVQAARIKELEGQNKELLEALEKVISEYIKSLYYSDRALYLGRAMNAATKVIAKAKGEER